MSADALRASEVTMVRRNVPEFEPAFQEELRAEEGELGAFQAMSLLAEWTRERLNSGRDDAAVRRAFETIEDLITDPRHQLGDALAAEFIEGIWDCPGVEALMGPSTRERAQPKR